jgi:predicted ArsR family transcriptional regulator
MVKSDHVTSALVATELQAVVLRACLDVWQRPTDLGASKTAVARRRLLARLVRRGWLETQDRTPEQLRAGRGTSRRWRLYRTTAAGRAALPGATMGAP